MNKKNNDAAHDNILWYFVILLFGGFAFTFYGYYSPKDRENVPLTQSATTSESEMPMTCNKDEAESIAEDRTESLGEVVLGSGFTTLKADNQHCKYVVQGLILPQQATEGKLVQMVIVKYSSGWNVDEVHFVN